MRWTALVIIAAALMAIPGCGKKEVEVSFEGNSLEKQLEGLSEEEQRARLQQMERSQKELGYMFEDFMQPEGAPPQQN